MISLARAYVNQAIVFKNFGRIEHAISLYNKAESLWQELEGTPEYFDRIHWVANLYMNKGVALKNLGKAEEALNIYDQAVEILLPLIDMDDHSGPVAILAQVYMNIGVALKNLDRLEEAMEQIHQAKELYKQLVYIQGHRTSIISLIKCDLNLQGILNNVGRYHETIKLFDSIYQLIECESDRSDRTIFNEHLGFAMFNKVYSLISLKEIEKAEKLAAETRKILQTEYDRTGKRVLNQLLDELDALFND